MSESALDIEKIKKRHAAATPGPYCADSDSSQSWTPEDGYAPTFVDTPAGLWRQTQPDTGAEMARQGADAEFLAHSWQDVLDLVAEVERLTRRNAELTESEERMARRLRAAEAKLVMAVEENRAKATGYPPCQPMYCQFCSRLAADCVCDPLGQ